MCRKIKEQDISLRAVFSYPDTIYYTTTEQTSCVLLLLLLYRYDDDPVERHREPYSLFQSSCPSVRASVDGTCVRSIAVVCTIGERASSTARRQRSQQVGSGVVPRDATGSSDLYARELRRRCFCIILLLSYFYTIIININITVRVRVKY